MATYSHEHSVVIFVPLIKTVPITALIFCSLTLAAAIFPEVKESGNDKANFAKFQTYAQNVKPFCLIVMQEASDALSKLQTVTLFRPIRSFQCSW